MLASVAAEDPPLPAREAWLERTPYLQWDSQTSRVVLAKAAGAGQKLSLRLQRPGIDEQHAEVIPMAPDQESGLQLAVLNNLKPAERYRYRLESGERKGNWSSYIMPPAEREPAPFRFAVYSDTQAHPGRHAKVARAMAGEKDLAFVLHCGDLTDCGQEEERWEREYFTPAAELLRGTMLLPCLGNHEEHGKLYFDSFKLPVAPGKKAWYSLNLGDVHLAVLDYRCDRETEEAQAKWLSQDLVGTPPDMWKVVMWHDPPFTRPVSVKWSQMQCKLCEENGVDLVFNGHDHHYVRTHPIGVPGRKAPIYIITGGGGGGTWPPPQLDFIAKGYETLEYCVVDVTGNELTVTAKKPNGEVIDRFTVCKGAIQPNIINRQDVIIPQKFFAEVERTIHNALVIHQVDGQKYECSLTLTNHTQQPVEAEFLVDTKKTAWAVDEAAQRATFEPGKETRLKWTLTAKDAQRLFPTPTLKGSNAVGDTHATPLPLGAAKAEGTLLLVNTPLKCDGIADEPFWKAAQPLGRLLCENGAGPPRNETQVRPVAGEEGLGVFIKCVQADPAAGLAAATQRDSDQVWMDDCIELFVEPKRGSGDYYHFVVSLSGNVYDAHRKDSAWNGAWQARVIKTAAQWNVEVLIPWSDLEMKGPPPPKAELGFNFSRTENIPAGVPGKYRASYPQWSLTYGDSHNPRCFGKLTVVKE